jgi:uncharacterized repeat protein (TIGR03803 family)
MQTLEGVLFGTSEEGGSGGGGTVFKVNPDGTGYGILVDFAGNSQDSPRGPLLQASDGALYGTTWRGGKADGGTLFRMNSDGTGYEVLRNFGDGQWRKDDTDLADAGNLSGTATATLTITSVSPTNAGIYCVVITNSFGSVTSPTAQVTVLTPPVGNRPFLALQPSFGPGSQTLCLGLVAPAKTGWWIETCANWHAWMPLVSIDVTNGVFQTNLPVNTGAASQFYRAVYRGAQGP